MLTDVTQELAIFLRTRRERLDPRDFALPQRRRRRTPGLRREEVAELAGISVDYVVRLEQARGLRPSAEVALALAGALRLNDDERAYLLGLTRRHAGDEAATEAAESLKLLVEDLSPRPAMVMNHRFDVLAWNDEMAEVLLDFGELPETRRNAVWLCLLHPEIRERYVDRDRVVREGVAHLRAAWAAHPDDQALAGLIAECAADDEEFARLWAARDVRFNARGAKVLKHPRAGEIALSFETLRPLQNPDQLLVIYRGADAASRAAVAQLNRGKARRGHDARK